MMQPVHTEDCDVVYKGPGQEVGDLWCHRVRPHLIQTTWEPDEEEREVLSSGGRVRVFIFKEPIAPLSVEVVASQESNPVGEHGWKIEVEPGDLRKEKDGERKNNEDVEESVDEVIGSAATTQSEAQSTPPGEASTSFPPRARVDGDSSDGSSGGSE